MKLYPGATLELRTRDSREAIRALYGAEADVAVTTRELLPEERKAAVQGRLEMTGYRFARDGLALVVGPGQDVENVSLDEVRAVYRGDVKDWGALGGAPRPIVPVVQTPGSDASDFFQEAVMEGEGTRAPSWVAAGDSAVLGYLRRQPGALGYVSMSALTPQARSLRVARLRGFEYSRLDAERVYDGRYPLTRDYFLYVRSDGARLAQGLVTFVTSRDGQSLVAESGLVPTTVPVRFVRRSGMKSTH